MKIKLLSAFSFDKGSFGAGEKIDVDRDTAYRLITKELAEPVNKKEWETFVKKIEEKKEKKKQEEELLQAKLQREALELELNALYEQVVEKEALLAGVVLTDEQKSKLIEELKNRETKVNNTTDGTAGKS